MGDEISGIDTFEDQLDALEATLGGVATVTGIFGAELERVRGSIGAAGTEAGTLSRSLSGGLRRAFDGLVFDGAKLSDALEGIARSMVNAAYSAAIKPVTQQLGGTIASVVSGTVSNLLPFENGAPFSQGRVMPFASGGVVTGPVAFPMRGGTGLMGEAGPEAIMPLRRGADGRLGVAVSGGGRPINVVMHVNTPDAQGFARSRTQIAAQMERALSRGARFR
ncbi:phage tail tape measure protein [Pseudoruegeria sp. SHC-113]|nr:phage tail tape measure protein [Pseudoruegeria sp. SHC-113]MCT8160125.1 phage tail tape measure protein [Pseudoruegeria sp. SHC-113]